MNRLLVVPILAALATGCFRQPVTRYPTKVLSAPFHLVPGRLLDVSQFEQRLERLSYTPAPQPQKAGEYSRDGDRIEVFLRGYAHPLSPGAAGVVRARFGGGRLERLEGPAGEPLPEAWLEPELLYEISGAQRVRRERSTFEKLPRHLLDAVVAVEDRRFYRHHGIDLRGLARAAWRDLRARRLLEGGSTLTQQLARNLYLSPRRTFFRKAEEILIALYLDLRYSKDDLLRMYLEQVYFAQDGPVSVCGVQAAARYFFDKTPDQLTVGDSALLAGLLASPYLYNPFRDPDRALTRRRVVLMTMREQGFLNPEQEQRARLEPLRITRAGHRPPRGADYFVSAVQEELERRYPGEALVTFGMTIHTTLDPWLQARAERVLSRARTEAAFVALDPPTGAVRALVGGRDFAKSPFNRAVSARRQPGSAFKPFVYGAALRTPLAGGKRWTAASTVPDTKTAYRAEGSSWTPKNFDGVYRGTTTVREALALSLNVPTVYIAQSIGIRRIEDYARSLGIQSKLTPNLGLALGDSEVSLLELTGAYAPFANGGSRVEPYTVEAVQEADGGVLEYRRPQGVPVLPPEEAWLVTDLLREAVRTGTARGLRRWGLQDVAAGKTGTTDWGRDAWFVGYVPGLLCGVWTGEDRPTRSSMTGASQALPLWAEVVSSAAPWAEERDPWPRPSTIVAASIDPASGLLARAGCPERREEFFLPGTEPTESCPLHQAGVVGWLKRWFRKR